MYVVSILVFSMLSYAVGLHVAEKTSQHFIEITLQDDERCSNINEVLNPAFLKH